MSNLTCTCGAILNHIDEPCPECLPSMAWRPSTKVCQECTRLTSERDEYWKERGEALTEVAELREKVKRADLWKDRESATQAKYEAVCYERDTLKTEVAELRGEVARLEPKDRVAYQRAKGG